MKHLARGFTLIELLVVIAIIGILASVVLASLSSARERSKDAAIRSNMDTVRKQSAIYFNGTGAGSYGVAHNSANCLSGATSFDDTFFVLDETANAAMVEASTIGRTSRCAVGVNGATYAYAVRMVSSSTAWFCIDSNGKAEEYGSTPLIAGGSNAARCP